MTWDPYYRGDGVPRDVRLPEPPPWRTFPRGSDAARVFEPPAGLVDAVNAALCLRRPLLVKGPPGSGKSTVIEQVATELKLEPVLRWHITSRSTVADAQYRYDALGRIYEQRRQHEGGGGGSDDIEKFIQLGPLGTALASSRKRALLIDELDKSDLDLPGDLLDVLERGEFAIPEIIREEKDEKNGVWLRPWDEGEPCRVLGGRVRCTEFPFIVMTSNGEQELPPAFLRRCVRFTMPKPDARMLRNVIHGWLHVDVPEQDGGSAASPFAALVEQFVERVGSGEVVAIDQLLNAVYLINGAPEMEVADRADLIARVLEDLSRA
jgi:MoxR-like ATPase